MMLGCKSYDFMLSRALPDKAVMCPYRKWQENSTAKTHDASNKLSFAHTGRSPVYTILTVEEL
jgi:hypothetical protein